MTEDLSGWQPARPPERKVLEGGTVRSLAARRGRHLAGLFEVASPDPDLWRYMPDGPFETEPAFRRWLERAEASEDPLFFTIAVQA